MIVIIAIIMFSCIFIIHEKKKEMREREKERRYFSFFHSRANLILLRIQLSFSMLANKRTARIN